MAWIHREGFFKAGDSTVCIFAQLKTHTHVVVGICGVSGSPEDAEGFV
jgi:hypothetical protein